MVATQKPSTSMPKFLYFGSVDYNDKENNITVYNTLKLERELFNVSQSEVLMDAIDELTSNLYSNDKEIENIEVDGDIAVDQNMLSSVYDKLSESISLFVQETISEGKDIIYFWSDIDFTEQKETLVPYVKKAIEEYGYNALKVNYFH